MGTRGRKLGVGGGGGGARSKGEGDKGGRRRTVCFPLLCNLLPSLACCVCVCRWPFQPRSQPFFACSGGRSSFVCWARAVPRRKLRNLLSLLSPGFAAFPLSLSPLLTESGGRLKRSVS